MNRFPIITEITSEVLHGAMDSMAEMLAISFANWLHLNYQPCGEIGCWYDHHNDRKSKTPIPTKQLYKKFIQEITNANNKGVV